MDYLLIALGVCAVLLMTLLTVTTFRVRRAARDNDEVLQRVEALGREGNPAEAVDVAHALPSAASAVVIAGMGAPDEAASAREMTVAMELQRAPFVRDLRFFEWIATAALIAPVVDALWTLSSLPADADVFPGLAGVAYAWLASCALALGIAMLATLGRFWLISRLRRLAIDMEKGASVVYNTAR